MTLVAVVAADYLVLQTIPSVSVLATRIGLFGALPMASIVAVCLALVLSSLLNRGEIRLSGGTFLLVGGLATLLLVHIAILAPQLLYQSVDLIGSGAPALLGFGLGRVNLIQALLVSVILTPLLLFPALLAGWATRGYRLKLMKSDGSLGDVKVPGALRRLRISITCLMVLVALIAVDIAVLRAAAPSGTPPRHIWLFGILPVENLLAVYLIVAVLSLRKRGDVALAHVLFVFVGGTAILLLLYVATLAPISSTGTKTSRRAP